MEWRSSATPGSGLKGPCVGERETPGRGPVSARLNLKATEIFWQRNVFCLPWERNVNSLHLAYFFARFQITSTAAISDLYRKPMRRAEESVNGHSSQASIFSQQVGTAHMYFRTEGHRERKALPSPSSISRRRNKQAGQLAS